MDRSSFSNVYHSKEEASSHNRQTFLSLYIRICLMKALVVGLENINGTVISQLLVQERIVNTMKNEISLVANQNEINQLKSGIEQ